MFVAISIIVVAMLSISVAFLLLGLHSEFFVAVISGILTPILVQLRGINKKDPIQNEVNNANEQLRAAAIRNLTAPPSPRSDTRAHAKDHNGIHQNGFGV